MWTPTPERSACSFHPCAQSPPMLEIEGRACGTVVFRRVVGSLVGIVMNGCRQRSSCMDNSFVVECKMSELVAAQNAYLRARTAMVALAVDLWRFNSGLGSVLQRLDANEQSRLLSRVRYFERRLEWSLAEVGLRVERPTGERFSAGLPVEALNLADFGADDELYVDTVVEPVVLGADGLVRAGTVLVRKANVSERAAVSEIGRPDA